MAIKVRKATEEDAAMIAQAILESSRAGKAQGVFDLIFESDDDAQLIDRIAALMKAAAPCYCNVGNFLIAESAAGASGILCNYEPRIATHDNFTKALGEVGVDETYEERIAAYLLCVPEMDRQTWVLDFICELPGTGSFEALKELVQKSLLTARLKGYRKVQAIVEIGDTETQMVYEKLGFRFVDEKRSSYYKERFGRPGIMRYAYAL
jgi:hypothetical protein